MKAHRLLTAVTVAFTASVCLLTAPNTYAGEGKEIPLQQGPEPVSQDEWHFSLTPYFWLPSTEVEISVPEVTVGSHTLGGDFSISQPWWDTLSKFSSNFYVLSVSGRFEAWKGRWGGFLDGYWVFGKSTISGSDSHLFLRDLVNVTTSSSVTSRFNTGQFNFGPQFRLATLPLGPDSSVSFVLYGGGRVNFAGNDLDGTLTIRASAVIGEIGQSFHFTRDESRAFIEPMIGLASSWSLGKNFKAILRGDVGGFGVVTANNWDCDLETAIAWEFRRNTYLDLGYRARGQWQDFGSNGQGNIRGWYFGPELGMTFTF